MGLISKSLLRGLIKERNSRLGVGHHQGVGQQTSELAISAFRMLKSLCFRLHITRITSLRLRELLAGRLKGSPLRDIADHGQNGRLIVELNGRRTDFHGNQTAILRSVAAFELQMPLFELRIAAGRHTPH